jgi:hypothetical protein
MVASFLNWILLSASKIETMDHYEPIGKVRLVRLFMETDLSDDKDLFECYGRFANLVEGINV